MENNDTKWVEHWIDYLKLDIQMDMRKATIYTVWIIALTSGTVFVYSVINNIYRSDLWINLSLFILLVFVIATEILSTRATKEIHTQYGTRGLIRFGIGSLINVLVLWGIGLLIMVFLLKEYFVFVLLVLPFYTLASGVVSYFYMFYLTFARVGFKRDMLQEILAEKGEIDPHKIYEIAQLVDKMELADIFRWRIEVEKELFERTGKDRDTIP